MIISSKTSYKDVPSTLIPYLLTRLISSNVRR